MYGVYGDDKIFMGFVVKLQNLWVLWRW